MSKRTEEAWALNLRIPAIGGDKTMPKSSLTGISEASMGAAAPPGELTGPVCVLGDAALGARF